MHDLLSWIQPVDASLLHRWYAAAGSPWVPFYQALSDTTSALAYGVPGVLLLIGLARRSRSLVLQALLLFATVLAADYSALFLKHTVLRARPYATYPTLFTPLSDGGNSSFPSGHTTQAMALAAGLSLLVRRWAVVLTACCWAALVGFSRMYLGMHYPTDVLGATLLSWGVAGLLVVPLRRSVVSAP